MFLLHYCMVMMLEIHDILNTFVFVPGFSSLVCASFEVIYILQVEVMQLLYIN